MRLQLICAHHLNEKIPSELRHAKSACGKHVLAVRRVGSVWTDALPRVRWCVEVTAKMALPRSCLAKSADKELRHRATKHHFGHMACKIRVYRECCWVPHLSDYCGATPLGRWRLPHHDPPLRRHPPANTSLSAISQSWELDIGPGPGHTLAHACTGTHKWHVRAHTRSCTKGNTHTNTRARAHTHRGTHPPTHTHTHPHPHPHTHTNTHTHTRARAHTHTHDTHDTRVRVRTKSGPGPADTQTCTQQAGRRKGE